MSEPERTVEVGGREIELSSLDKVLFENAGLTKGDVVDYYRRIADVMLPHLEDRPISMQRFPDGLDGESFYQKRVPDHFPDWIETAELETREGETVRQVVVDSTAALVYLANQACLTFHPWLSTVENLERPDWLVFDLDPPVDGEFDEVVFAARQIREALDEREVPSLVMTTGSDGLHVRVRLERRYGFDEVRSRARALMEELAEEHPDRLTTEQRKEKRRGRIYLDTGRNAYGQTAVAPYSVRARPGAPIAAPVEWDELGGSDFGPRKFTMGNVFRRLGQRDDPWASVPRASRLPAPDHG